MARYNDRHPLVVNIRAERRDIQRAIAAEMQRMGANVQNEYELAKSRVDALEQSLREATGQTGAEDKTAITLRELERTAAVNKTLFENFLQKAKITQEQSTFDAQDARVITPAQPPGAPSYPKKSREIVIALFIGLLVGVGGALAQGKADDRFCDPATGRRNAGAAAFGFGRLDGKQRSDRQWQSHEIAPVSRSNAAVTFQ